MVGAPNSSNSKRLVEVGAQGRLSARRTGAARRAISTGRSFKVLRPHRIDRRRLGAGSARQRDHRCVPRPLRRDRLEGHAARGERVFKLPRELREAKPAA